MANQKKQVSEKDPGLAAFTLLMGRQDAKAERAFTKLIKTDPKNVDYYMYRSSARSQLQKYEEAVSDLKTALHHAGADRKTDIKELLSIAEAEAALMKGGPLQKYLTPLYSAAEAGNLKEVKRLVEEKGANLELGKSARRSNRSPLHIAAEKGHLQIVRYLTGKGAQVDSKMDTNLWGGARHWTPLMHAACRDHLDVVKFLVKAGANPNYKDEEGCTVLWASVREDVQPAEIKKSVEMSDFLLKSGAKIDPESKKGLELARQALKVQAQVEKNRRLKPKRNQGVNYWLLHTNRQLIADLGELIAKSAPKRYLYHDGVSLLAKFPKNAKMRFTSMTPVRTFQEEMKAKKPPLDFICNRGRQFVVSARVRELIAGLKLKNVEFLPVKLEDPEGKPLPLIKGYSIMNVVGCEHAIDMRKSKYELDSIFPGQIDKISRLVLDRSNIDEDAKIFRAKTMTALVFIRDDVKTALEAQGVRGCTFVKAEGSAYEVKTQF